MTYIEEDGNADEIYIFIKLLWYIISEAKPYIKKIFCRVGTILYYKCKGY